MEVSAVKRLKCNTAAPAPRTGGKIFVGQQRENERNKPTDIDEMICKWLVNKMPEFTVG